MATFLSSIKNLTFFANVNGRTLDISFEHTNASQKGGVFRTNNKDIIKALKSHKMYGIWFALEESEPEEEIVEPVEKVSYPNVTRTQEANKILMQDYAISKDLLRSKEDALRFANELNLEFPNLK